MHVITKTLMKQSSPQHEANGETKTSFNRFSGILLSFCVRSFIFANDNIVYWSVWCDRRMCKENQSSSNLNRSTTRARKCKPLRKMCVSGYICNRID